MAEGRWQVVAWLSRRGAPEHGMGNFHSASCRGFPLLVQNFLQREPHALSLPSLVWPWLLCPRLSQLTPYAFQCPAPLVGLWDMDPGPGPSLQMPSAGPSEAV